MLSFPFEKKFKIIKSLDSALDGGANPIAAFDADGTLWDLDVGENFFEWQIQNKVIPNLPDDPWGYYRKLHSENAEAAFLWLASINKGFSIEQVREWAAEAVKTISPLPYFGSLKDIIKHLHDKNVAVYVVTASIKWSVEPAAKLLGIPFERVIGVKTKVVNGVITDEQDGPVTWREGKVTGLLEATGRKPPFFAAGNTMGDLALLDCATHLRFANSGAEVSHTNFATEQKLNEIAQKRGWLFHKYRS
jgi:phosphoserine phosphatase